MRIIRLQAEGFKRLVAVDISPEGDLVEIRGNNGNGKSSVLDAIYSALAGAGAAPEKPVREGEEAAVIRLDLGNLIVTRYFTAEGTTGLKVTTPDGANYSSAQTMLDKLVGHISFDPLEFLDLKPAEQAEELRKLVDIVDPETGEALDLSAIEAEVTRMFDERREVNRDGKKLVGRIEALGGVRHVPEDAPDAQELRAKLASAAETNSAIDAEARRRHDVERELSDARQEVNVLRHKLEQAEMRLKAREDDVAAYASKPLDDKVDVAELSKALDDADRIAENRRHNEQRDQLKAEFDELKARSGKLTEEMNARKDERARAIAAAKMPVEGLELVVEDDGKLGVMFNRVPFSQASDAERLRVSAAVAMAANPELRVIRLKDASLLDKAAVETLRSMATENDFQIWAEFVGDEGPGIVMEAGAVRGAEAPEPLDKPRKRKPKAEEGEEAPEGEDDASTPAEAADTAERRPEASATPSAPRQGETMFERMQRVSAASETSEERETRKPRAMTEFTSKPKGSTDA